MKLRALFAAIAAVVAFVAMPAAATQDRFNATDLWINPNESGWGLNVIHQGGTLFKRVLTYETELQLATLHKRMIELSALALDQLKHRLENPPLV